MAQTGTFDINNIRSNLPLGGARPTLFQVKITNPSSPVADIVTPFRVMATQVPVSQIGTIPVPYMGRTIKNPGDRVFGEWNVTIMEDEDWSVRNALELWNSQINTIEGNLRAFATSASLLLKSSGTISLLGKTGSILREYTIEGIWPKQIQQIGLDWSATDRMVQYDVTFELDWCFPSFVGSNVPPFV